MFNVDERITFDVDYQRFELLLLRIYQLTSIFIEIKNLNGETMVAVPKNPVGNLRDNEESVPKVCHIESFILCQEIQKSGEPIVQKCSDAVDIIGLPLTCNKNIFAVLFACKSTEHGNISMEARGLLEEVAHIISHEIESGFEIENIALELSDKYEELTLMYDIGKTLGGISRAKDAISFIVKQSQETFHSNLVLASIPSNNIQEISNSSLDNMPFNINDKLLLNKISELLLMRFSSPDPGFRNIVINNIRSDMQLNDLFDVPMGILAVPVKLKGNVTGFLCIFNFNLERPFQTGDVKLATSLAQQISMALTNAELYQNLKDFLVNVIKTLVSSIEAKDSYTKGHSQRVNALTMLIARKMDLPPEDLEQINWASMLHDIGKIGVPEEILTKPGKLTEKEFLNIREHPERGYRILIPIEQLKGSLNGIRHHHERFDGQGYPLGLKGKEIPLHARIIAVADSYDAMTSDRSYRAKMSHEDAISELLRVKGTQLDPELVTIFVHQIKNLINLKSEY